MARHLEKSKISLDTREKIILVGNPNVGKSVIFNYLTRKYVIVSNYPGTTVEVTYGTAHYKKKTFTVVDTPGVNSLIPSSEDEKVTRDILLSEPNALIVQVADAKNLRRALFISCQLSEMGLPFILVLNMADEAKSRGIAIQADRLSRNLGVPVLFTVATRKEGLDQILEEGLSARPAAFKVEYGDPLEEEITALAPKLPVAPLDSRALALMVLAGDETLQPWLGARLTVKEIQELEAIQQKVQSRFHEPLGYWISRTRMQRVDWLLKEVISQKEPERRGFSQTLGRLSTHPVWGIPILAAVLFLIYEFVGVLGAKVAVEFMEGTVFRGIINPFITRLVKVLIPLEPVQDLLVGPYGIFTMAFTYALALILPIVGFFFITFGIMEDSGYLPRLAVMSNRLFKMMGLNGKAILPMILGLGCDTMATMTTRILETPKDRIIVTLLLALGVPCSAQLAVILGMLGGISASMVWIWAGIIFGVILLVGYLSGKVIPGERGSFILELPPIRRPSLANVLIKTLARIEWYLKEAVPLFILGTLILFLLNRTGALAWLEQAASPLIVHVLGLPAQATAAFLIGFLRRDYGAAGFFALAKAGILTVNQTLVALVTITLFVPCIANFLVIIKERGWRVALMITGVVMVLAFGIGGILNLVLRSFGIQL
jgi:ferrous iron transport protein B